MIPLKSTKMILTALIIGNIVIYSTYILMFKMIKETTQETSELSIQIEREIKKEEIRGSMESSLLLSDSDFDSLQDYMIKADGEIDFIKEMETIATGLGLKSEIKSVKLEPIEKILSAEKFEMSIDVIGKWSSVYNFLRRLERLPFKINLEKVNLEKFSEEGGAVLWLGQFEFDIVKLKSK